MSHCQQKDDHDVSLILLFSAIALGALSAGIPCGLFIKKWYECIKDFETRKSRLIHLTGLVLWTLPFERILRLIEVSLRFFVKQRLWATLCYYLNNLISISCICTASFILQTVRLSTTFKGSSYSVRKRELRGFYALIALLTSMMYLTSVFLGITEIPRSVSVSMGLLSGILAVLVILKLEVAFATRLRGLVAKQTARSIEKGIASPTVKAHVQHSPNWNMNSSNHSMSDFSVSKTPRTPTQKGRKTLTPKEAGKTTMTNSYHNSNDNAGALSTAVNGSSDLSMAVKRDTLSIAVSVDSQPLTPGNITPTDSRCDCDYNAESSDNDCNHISIPSSSAMKTADCSSSAVMNVNDSNMDALCSCVSSKIRPPKLTMIVDESLADGESDAGTRINESEMHTDHHHHHNDDNGDDVDGDGGSSVAVEGKSELVDSSNVDSYGGGGTPTVISVDDPSFMEFDIFNVRPTLRIIHESSISHFDDPHKEFLLAATKSTLLTLFMTLSIVCFTAGIMLIGIGECSEPASIIGHSLYAIGDLILSLSFFLSLSYCSREYRYCCSGVNRWISKLVAYQTGREVRELTSQHNSKLNEDE